MKQAFATTGVPTGSGSNLDSTTNQLYVLDYDCFSGSLEELRRKNLMDLAVNNEGRWGQELREYQHFPKLGP